MWTDWFIELMKTASQRPGGMALNVSIRLVLANSVDILASNSIPIISIIQRPRRHRFEESCFSW